MAASKEDIQRAKSIMANIVSELSDSLDPGEEEGDSLLAVQNVLDILQSPLFAAVVDIRDQYKKHVQESEKWNEAADVKVLDTADVVAQFKERYNITGDEDMTSARQSSTLPDRLLDDTSISTSPESPQHLGCLSQHLSDEYGSTLNKQPQPQRSPSISSTDSRSSANSKKKAGKRRGKGVTLSELAHDPGQEIPLMTVSAMPPSMSSEVYRPPLPPSFPPDSFSPTHASSATSTTPDKVQEEACEGHQPKDILFFMRDKKSMTDVRTALNGKWGCGQRRVILPCESSIQVVLCGLSTQGVFVSEVTEPILEDRLQSGDEILEVDGSTVSNMAWFEVQRLLQAKNRSSSEEISDPKHLGMIEMNSHVLLVQYNPTGMGEIKRQENKVMNRN